ncbi:MAG: hypothetical protein NVS2B16_14430 [Chloroflexota bacterium]
MPVLIYSNQAVPERTAGNGSNRRSGCVRILQGDVDTPGDEIDKEVGVRLDGSRTIGIRMVGTL